MNYFSYMFRLTLKPSSGCLHVIKNESSTAEILKYMKIYVSQHLQFVTTVCMLCNDMNCSNNSKILTQVDFSIF